VIVVSLALLAAVLFGLGVFLALQRALTRIVTGIVLMGHGAVVLLLISGGPAGEAPLVPVEGGVAADPLPQALALTAIVISFGLAAFLLVLAYRSWTIRHTDEVEDDVEDRRIARLALGRARAGDARTADPSAAEAVEAPERGDVEEPGAGLDDEHGSER
jgi:multicomponent Na+:H+ antiporter subunit C